jgi:cytochrome bd-type quinol oxidase subunit 2
MDSDISVKDEDAITLNSLRVEALYNHGVMAAIITLLGVLLLFIVCSDNSFTIEKKIWLFLLSILSIVRYLTVRFYKSSKKSAEEYPLWLNIYFIGVICSGSIIGASPYIYIDENNTTHINLLITFSLVLFSGSIRIFSVFQRIYYGFNLPLIVPLIIYLLTSNNETLVTHGYIVCLYTICIIAIQIQSHRIINQLLLIKLDNKNLLKTYEIDKEKINLLERLHNTKAKQVEELKVALKISRSKLNKNCN